VTSVPGITPLLAAWVALVGATIGSFLNVVIARVPAGQSIVRPGSRCPRCASPIRWYDNVPILSWLWLRARCRTCGAPISFRYPLVEVLGASAALVAFGRHGLSGAAAAELAFAAALVALAFIDVDTWLLPNTITWPLIAFGLAMAWLGVTPAGSVRAAVQGAGLGFGAFGLIAWLGEKVFRKEALGFGDVWLLAGLGGWMGPSALLPVVLLASIQGSIVGLALLALGRGEPGPEGRAPAGGSLRQGTDSRPEGDEEAAPAPEIPTPAPDSRPPGPRHVSAPEAEWVPPRHAVPFGPFLVAGALEWLWLGGLLARAVPVLQLFR
jgi:leader peptidase (prepilin peptidase)/N-methyltransferase